MRTKLLISCEDDRRAISLGQRFKQVPAPGVEEDAIDPVCIPWHRLFPSLGDSRWHILLLECGDAQLRGVMDAVRRFTPDTDVLVSCEHVSQERLLSLIKLGVRGCIVAADTPDLMAKAVRSVRKGETWFGRTALGMALRSLVAPKRAAAAAPMDDGVLTHRELQVFQLASLALTNKEIARHLEISDYTVKTHLHRIYVKLHQSGRYKALLSQPASLPPQ